MPLLNKLKYLLYNNISNAKRVCSACEQCLMNMRNSLAIKLRACISALPILDNTSENKRNPLEYQLFINKQ